jgi:hypothetical protein
MKVTVIMCLNSIKRYANTQLITSWEILENSLGIKNIMNVKYNIFNTSIHILQWLYYQRGGGRDNYFFQP